MGDFSLALDGPPARSAIVSLDKPGARARALVSDHFDFVWRLLRRLGVPEADVDDAAQQVFIVGTRRLADIAPGSERTFLYGTALRTAATTRRNLRRRERFIQSVHAETEASERTPHDELERRRALSFLDTVLLALDDDQRVVFVLCEIEELSAPQVASLVGIPVGTVASRLRRAPSLCRRAQAPESAGNMTTMIGSDSFLEKEPEELERFLLQLARQDVAPEAARERALLNVASIAAGASVLSGATAAGSPPSLVKATGWLVAKWLSAGLGAGLLTITAAQGVQQFAAGHPPSEPAARGQEPRHAEAKGQRPRGPSPITPQAESPVVAPAPAESAQVSASAAVVAPPVVSLGAADSAGAPSARDTLPTAPNSESPSSLTRELSLLEQARGALSRQAGAQALRALDEYSAEFPSGSLQVEAAALRVEAVGLTGNRALARRLAESFLISYPSSPLSTRVRAAADAFRADAPRQ